MAVKTQVKNSYELLVILKPGISNDDLEKNISQIENAIKNYGGSVVKIDEPVRKRFTHKIKTFKDGYYIPVLFNAPSEVPNVLKRSLSITDDVLRYIVVRKNS